MGFGYINVNITDISAILLTHEHIDHTRSLGTISAKYNIPVYANSKTWQALNGDKDKISDFNRKTFNILEDFEIGDLKILPFAIPHDAAAPCGFNIYNKNKKISIATDLGHVDKKTIKQLEGSSYIMLESNYDPEILKFCSYPSILKKRISGPNGHLPNNIAGETICKLINYGLKDVLLVHLSKENNFPELAYETSLEELRKNNYTENSISLNIAPRNKPSEIFNIN